MMGLSPLELGVLAGVVVLLFGVKRLPELGSGLGQGISNFRKAFREGNAIDVTPQEAEKKLEADNKTLNEASSKEKSPSAASTSQASSQTSADNLSTGN